MSRKSVMMKTGSEELYKQTDFYRRFSKFLTRGLKDHRYGAEFKLDAQKRYSDDSDQAKFEIGTSNNEQFLVFVLSLVKIAYPMDEAKFLDKVTLNLELRANNLDSFSKVGSFPLSLLANVAMAVVFLGGMYLLFPVLRNTAFVVFRRSQAVEPSESVEYRQVSSAAGGKKANSKKK